MKTIEAENVVLGAGAAGSMAAFELARRGEQVMLVEQFGPGHDRGSSHGAARITRHSYSDPLYARLMPMAFRAWREFEALCGRTVYVRTGGVTICSAGSDHVALVARHLDALGVPNLRASGAEWNRIQPAFGLPADAHTVFEPDAGMLLAAQALERATTTARVLLGDRMRVLEHTRVRSIDLDGNAPVLVCDGLAIRANRLIVAAGAWVDRLLPGLAGRREVTRQQVLYFRPADLTPYELGQFPVFISMGLGPDAAFYGMPACLGMGVKVARHAGPEVDPDLSDRAIDPAYIDGVREFLRVAIPGLAQAAVDRTETCLYTVDPREHFLLDLLPGHGRVVVASACSGHGFKFSCLVGRVAVALALEGGSQIHPPEWTIAARLG